MAEPMRKKAYHIVHGESIMYNVDANNAVANFPDEWSFEPWSDAEAEMTPKEKAVLAKRAAAKAKEQGAEG